MQTAPQKQLIIVRGGGDLATGVIQKLWRAGFCVLVLECARPTAIRRTVALCEAVYEGEMAVEDIRCRRIETLSEMSACHGNGVVPLLVDETAACAGTLRPFALVDVILAKRNVGTHCGMAPVTVGLGPGFTAGQDVDAVIETMRGHNLGRLILQGSALPNTGVPGEIGGKSAQRVLHAANAGTVRHNKHIGDIVQQGEAVYSIDGVPAMAPFTGLLRGLIREGLTVPKGMKMADIDPRTDVDWRTISDKARCLGGAALEAVLYLHAQKQAYPAPYSAG